MTLLGWIAWDVGVGKPGHRGYAGRETKVYKSEAVARAAVAEKVRRGWKFTFHRAFVDLGETERETPTPTSH